MIGDQYRLFGTDNLFEITAELGDDVEVTIRSSTGQELGGLWMPKQALIDGVQRGKLVKT